MTKPGAKIFLILKRIFAFCLVASVVLGAFIYFLSEKLLFPGALTRVVPEERKLYFQYSEVWQRDLEGGGKTEAIFLRSEGVSQGTVVFAHGNGELADDWIFALNNYRTRIGLNILILEYRGYGYSGGKPDSEDISSDVLYFLETLNQREDKGNRLIFHGRSLGGLVLCSVIDKTSPDQLILESTFTSVAEIVWDKFRLPSFLVKNKMDCPKNLALFKGSTLVIHGDSDQVVPQRFGERLYSSATQPKKIVILQGIGHNDSLTSSPEYWNLIADFIN